MGHLDLVCTANADGQSFLSQQSFAAPMHLSKPHLDEGVLVVNAVNPTAGLLEGDRIRMSVRVEKGARMLLTAPSANRAHRMRTGRAEVVQEFVVESGGSLEVLPELFIPQAGTRFSQRTVARVEDGGELFLFETLAPGRVASGETFAYDSLAWSTDVFWAGSRVVRERYRLCLEDESLQPIRAEFPRAYYASGTVISPLIGADSPCWPAIHALHAAEVWIGCSRLANGGWAIKILADGSPTLRRTIVRVRQEIYFSIGRQIPALRHS